MYGICGWISELADARESAKLLWDMAADCGTALTPTSLPGLHSGTCHAASLSTDGRDAGKRLFADEQLLVVTSDLVQRASGKTVDAEELADRYRTDGERFLYQLNPSS